MHFSQIRLVIGEIPRSRHKTEAEDLDQYFTNPIIHKQINGEKVYVPLNIDRIWDEIS